MSNTLYWSEIMDKEDCSLCPIYDAGICSGGMVCYGGSPIEPPCCSFEPDTELYAWIDGYYDMRNYEFEQEMKAAEAERKRKERAKKAAETKRALNLYCYHELYVLKNAKKRLQSYISQARMIEGLRTVANIMNNRSGTYKEDPEITQAIENAKIAVKAAQAAYESKRKEFYAKRKSKGE